MVVVHSARRKGAYMPRTKTGKGAGGAGSIRKITTTKNGKTYCGKAVDPKTEICIAAGNIEIPDFSQIYHSD